jgi:hypothetical protein
VAAYRLTEPAAFMLGRPVVDNGGRDFFGSPIKNEQPLFIGVHQADVATPQPTND